MDTYIPIYLRGWSNVWGRGEWGEYEISKNFRIFNRIFTGTCSKLAKIKKLHPLTLDNSWETFWRLTFLFLLGLKLSFLDLSRHGRFTVDFQKCLFADLRLDEISQFSTSVRTIPSLKFNIFIFLSVKNNTAVKKSYIVSVKIC